MATQNTNPNANARFGCKAHHKDIGRLLATIREACREVTKGDVTWSDAGSLGHVREQLIEVVAFLTGDERSEIEERLAE
jgi:uncharacterized NAD(P)/FAD-binding protein YdhS